MSVGHGHGEGSQKQFIDTIGGYDQAHGDDSISLDVFYATQHVVTGNSSSGTVYWNTSLARIVQQTGNDLVKQFQFFKINSFTLYCKDLDYGQGWSHELQGYDIYVAPWKNTPYVANNKLTATYANALPGCVWKTMTAPSCGAQLQASPATSTLDNQGPLGVGSSGTSQMINITVDKPVFVMDVYGAGGTDVQGRQINSTYLPTYSREGIDTTAWHGVIMRYSRYSGGTSPPSNWFILCTVKANISFKGFRFATNIDAALLNSDAELLDSIGDPDIEEDGHAKSRESNRLGSDAKKPKASGPPKKRRRDDKVSEKDTDRAQGNE